MALSTTLLAANNSTSTTSTFSAAVGDLITFWIICQNSTAPTLVTPTGLIFKDLSGVTGNPVISTTADISGFYLAMYAGKVTSTITTQAITWTSTGAAIFYNLADTTGVLASTVAGAIIQAQLTNTLYVTSPATSPTLTTISGTSQMVGFFYISHISGVGSSTLSAGANMTAISTLNVGAAAPGYILEVSTSAGSPATSCQASWTNAGASIAHVLSEMAIEIGIGTASGKGFFPIWLFAKAK